MPPHTNDEPTLYTNFVNPNIFTDHLHFTTTADGLNVTTTTADETTTNAFTVNAAPWYTTTTLNDAIQFGRHYDHDELKVEVDLEVDRRLERIFKKMYEIIHDICNFSISEDEFMKLLKED